MAPRHRLVSLALFGGLTVSSLFAPPCRAQTAESDPALQSARAALLEVLEQDLLYGSESWLVEEALRASDCAELRELLEAGETDRTFLSERIRPFCPDDGGEEAEKTDRDGRALGNRDDSGSTEGKKPPEGKRPKARRGAPRPTVFLAGRQEARGKDPVKTLAGARLEGPVEAFLRYDRPSRLDSSRLSSLLPDYRYLAFRPGISGIRLGHIFEDDLFPLFPAVARRRQGPGLVYRPQARGLGSPAEKAPDGFALDWNPSPSRRRIPFRGFLALTYNEALRESRPAAAAGEGSGPGASGAAPPMSSPAATLSPWDLGVFHFGAAAAGASYGLGLRGAYLRIDPRSAPIRYHAVHGLSAEFRGTGSRRRENRRIPNRGSHRNPNAARAPDPPAAPAEPGRSPGRPDVPVLLPGFRAEGRLTHRFSRTPGNALNPGSAGEAGLGSAPSQGLHGELRLRQGGPGARFQLSARQASAGFSNPLVLLTPREAFETDSSRIPERAGSPYQGGNGGFFLTAEIPWPTRFFPEASIRPDEPAERRVEPAKPESASAVLSFRDGLYLKPELARTWSRTGFAAAGIPAALETKTGAGLFVGSRWGTHLIEGGARLRHSLLQPGAGAGMEEALERRESHSFLWEAQWREFRERGEFGLRYLHEGDGSRPSPRALEIDGRLVGAESGRASRPALAALRLRFADIRDPLHRWSVQTLQAWPLQGFGPETALFEWGILCPVEGYSQWERIFLTARLHAFL